MEILKKLKILELTNTKVTSDGLKYVTGKESSIKYVRKISRKTNIFYPPIRTRTCVYQVGKKC